MITYLVAEVHERKETVNWNRYLNVNMKMNHFLCANIKRICDIIFYMYVSPTTFETVCGPLKHSRACGQPESLLS